MPSLVAPGSLGRPGLPILSEKWRKRLKNRQKWQNFGQTSNITAGPWHGRYFFINVYGWLSFVPSLVAPGSLGRPGLPILSKFYGVCERSQPLSRSWKFPGPLENSRILDFSSAPGKFQGGPYLQSERLCCPVGSIRPFLFTVWPYNLHRLWTVRSEFRFLLANQTLLSSTYKTFSYHESVR